MVPNIISQMSNDHEAHCASLSATPQILQVEVG